MVKNEKITNSLTITKTENENAKTAKLVTQQKC